MNTIDISDKISISPEVLASYATALPAFAVTLRRMGYTPVREETLAPAPDGALWLAVEVVDGSGCRATALVGKIGRAHWRWCGDIQ